jgi:hypothetical protein
LKEFNTHLMTISIVQLFCHLSQQEKTGAEEGGAVLR